MKPGCCASRIVAGALSATLIAGVSLFAGTAAAAPILSATKSDALLVDIDGDAGASAGDTLRYGFEIENLGDMDALAVALSDVPDTNTTLVVGSVTTTQGSITSGNAAGDTDVSINVGTMGAGASVIVSFDALINPGIPVSVTEVSNQGIVNGENFAAVLTDDPDLGGASDPTVTPISRGTEAVPEPMSLAIFSFALVGLFFAQRSRIG